MAPPAPEPGPLAAAMVTLAGLPDHASPVDALLARIARLAARRVGADTHPSITALRGDACTTVAVSDESGRRPRASRRPSLSGRGRAGNSWAPGQPPRLADDRAHGPVHGSPPRRPAVAREPDRSARSGFR